MLSMSGLCSQDAALEAMAKTQLDDKDGASSGFDDSESTKSTQCGDTRAIPTKNTFIHYDTPAEETGSPRRHSCPPVPQIIVDRPTSTQKVSLWSDCLKDNGDLASMSGLGDDERRLSMETVPDLLEVPSVGSVEHSQGSCRPCAWHWKTEGCVNGVTCLYCHLCSKDELKKRKKEKIAKLRKPEEKDDEEAADGSISPKTLKTPKTPKTPKAFGASL